ncbi:MAG TPA: carboxypeptidase regulatory-like domain-containing protein [Candidatus Eisenbacteria bacterium]|nr:carboxypeptidase regulatory-like domain-containing protein [Candidatus Eisenbacteria bacterium]
MKGHRFTSNHFVCASLLASLALLVALLFPSLTTAQTNGLISGTVTDKSGAAIVGAKVVITNDAGNLTRTTVSNSDGVYVASALPSGKYTIRVSAKGFQEFEARDVVLEVAQKARVDVTLSVGTITEQVVVSGENVAQVNTQSSEIGSTITGKQVQQLSLNGRNFTQLVTLAPGVVNQTGQDEGTVGIAGNVLYSINGGRTEYNNWEIDGGDNMDNGSNSSLNVYPNLEAIAEFKVLTSNYGAQYGKNGSGTVEVETKSGTNQFHGSAFYYGRNDFFNANSWQNNGQDVPRPSYKKHDWGYTFGGPVFIPHVYNNSKNKTFFFWSQEWRREIQPGSTISQPVPSDAERGGDFNDVCPVYTGAAFDTSAFPDCPSQPNSPGTPFVNNTVSTPFSSTATALLGLIPNANNFSGVNGLYASGQAEGNPLPSYVANPSFPTHWREELIRVDHNLTDNQRLTFRYIHDTWATVNQGPLWGQYDNTFDNTNTNFQGPTTSFVAKLTSNFTPSLLNEFVASYTDDHIYLSNVDSNVNLPSGGIDLVPLFANGLGNKIPAFTVGATNNGVVYGGGFSVDTGYFPWKNANPTYSYRDIVTKIIGNHTLFFGAYFVAAQKNQASSLDVQGQLAFDASDPNSTGNPFADLLVGSISGYGQDEKNLYYYDRFKILEPFFQDDWRVTKRLTLNLGLRWSVYGRYQEKTNQEFGFSPLAYSASAAPSFFPLGSDNGQLLNVGDGQFLFNGLIQCGQSNPTIPGVSGSPTGCMKNKWVNPGPRIGFAYDPFGDGKWAIRGGYGIFFEHMNGNEANAESLQFSASPLAVNGGVGSIVGYPNVGSSAENPPPSPLGAISIPDQVQWPYMQQWNFGIEHELPSNILLSVAYVGSKGTHLTRQYDLNQLPPIPSSENPYVTNHLGAMTGDDCNSIQVDDSGDINDPNWGLPTSASIMGTQGTTPVTVTDPNVLRNLFVACGNPGANYYRKYQGYGTITRVDNTANSIYHSLQIALRRTIGDLTLSASYTYSHSIDNSSDRYDALFVDSDNPAGARGTSNFDVRHSFVVSYVYALPFFKSPGLTHTLLGGWQVSGITTALSGSPFTVTNGTTYSDNAGVANGATGIASFPSLVSNPYGVTQAQRQALADQSVFGVLDYNPSAFSLPTGLTFGTVSRNNLTLPGRVNFDFGLFKRFSFKERYAFEFRWENFNVFNHTQLTSISGNANAFAGGATTSMTCVGANSNAGDPSCLSSGFLVLDGARSPRIMQFGLRFQF